MLRRSSNVSRLLSLLVLSAVIALAGFARALAQAPEGFGENTTGGAGKPIVMVTNLLDFDANEPAIAGSLRQALSGGDREVHFAVAGDILLKRKLEIRSRSNVTVDGSTAPAPGITLKHDEFEIRFAHNIIIRHIRLRDTADKSDSTPGFTVFKNCSDIWLDHVSASRISDESIQFYGGSLALAEGAPTDATVSWSLFFDALHSGGLPTPTHGKGLLIGGPGTGDANVPLTGVFADRITVHHNVLSNNPERNPQVSGNTQTSTDMPLVDIRNNIFHNWTDYGTRMRYAATGNVVKNIYLSSIKPGDALEILLSGPIFVQGNSAPPQLPGSVDINTLGTTGTPIAAPPITETSVANLAATLIGDGITTGVGALPRDAVDAAAIARLSLDLGAFLQTCAQLGGTGCASGTACNGGTFTPSKDFGSLCCVGGTCMAPSGTDTDGDGVEDALDDCPAIYNPGQQDTDGDGPGDACDITVTFPRAGDVLCADAPPIVTWTPKTYDHFKVFLGADPNFKVKVTSGKKLLTGTSYAVPLAKWTKICGKIGVNLSVRIFGKTAATRATEFSAIDTFAVK